MPTRYFVAYLVACLLIIVLLGSAYSAFAQAACAPVEKVEATLAKSGMKVAADLRLRTETGDVPMRVFAHLKSGAWFLIAYPASGLACWWAAGEGYKPARLRVVPS
jgi:hypothetical protein